MLRYSEGCNLKRALGLVTVILLLGVGILAADKNAADYPLTAHILGTSKQHTRGGTTSAYNTQTGAWSNGTYSGSTRRETELRIGNLIYGVNRVCKEVEVGKDYPAKTDKRKIHLLLPDGKTCDATIESTREAQ
jgi:hypothetical protein